MFRLGGSILCLGARFCARLAQSCASICFRAAHKLVVVLARVVFCVGAGVCAKQNGAARELPVALASRLFAQKAHLVL